MLREISKLESAMMVNDSAVGQNLLLMSMEDFLQLFNLPSWRHESHDDLQQRRLTSAVLTNYTNSRLGICANVDTTEDCAIGGRITETNFVER